MVVVVENMDKIANKANLSITKIIEELERLKLDGKHAGINRRKDGTVGMVRIKISGELL